MRYLILLVVSLFTTSHYAMAPKVNLDKAIDNAVIRYGLQYEPHLISLFEKAKVMYPPQQIALLAFKKERHIQLWAKDYRQSWHYIHTYPLTAYSGQLGPKLKEHDGQIPEGVYKLVTFNPFSSMHLSLMINYPNHFDRVQASKEGRRNLGGDIFLHGKAVSVGCLAIGDKAIDQLFLLVRRVGLRHVQLVIAPNDLRRSKPATTGFTQPQWLPQLYKEIRAALSSFPISQRIS